MILKTIKDVCEWAGSVLPVGAMCVETGSTYIVKEENLIHTTTNNIANFIVKPLNGSLYSFDISSEHQEVSKRLCAGLNNIEFVLGDSVERLGSFTPSATVDFLCLDSKEFDPAHMVKEFEAIKKHLSKNHLVLVDDIHNSKSVKWVQMVPMLKDLGYSWIEVPTPTGLFIASTGYSLKGLSLVSSEDNKVFVGNTYEDILKDKARFEALTRGQDLWEEYTHTEEQIRSIITKLRFLINTQNGTGLDDYIVASGTRFVDRVCTVSKDKDVLVLGTGTGREMSVLRKFGASRIEGVTMSKRNQKFAELIVGERPIVCDIHALPWENSSFDFITGFQVFEHTYSPPLFLLEANRLLKVGGTLFLETPDAKSTTLGHWLHHILCPTPRQLFALLIKTGYKPKVIILGGTVKYDVSNYTTEENLPSEWADLSDVYVYVEAQKLEPSGSVRGAMERYYTILSGGPFLRE